MGEITSALQIDDSAVVDAAKDKLQVIRDKVGIFVLFDDTGGWDRKRSLGILQILEKIELSLILAESFSNPSSYGIYKVAYCTCGDGSNDGHDWFFSESYRHHNDNCLAWSTGSSKGGAYGRPARLIASVSEDEKDLDRFYRYLEIVVQDTNETGKWLIQGDGKFLEDGVFLVPSEDYSKIKVPDDWSELAYSVWSHEDDAGMKLKESLKGVREEGGTKVFSFLEFNGEGNLVCSHKSESSFPPYPKLVLANGSPSPGSDEFLRFDEVNSVLGILLRKFGGFAILESNDFVTNGSGSSNGSGY